MHGISKYILIILILLLTYKTTRDISVLSDQQKKIVISFVETLNINAVSEKHIFPEYISRKEEIDNSHEVNIPMELLASKNLKANNSESINFEGFKNFPTTKKDVSAKAYFRVVFDNDIFDNTDYYYTNGVRFEYVSPILNRFSLGKLLPSVNNADIDIQGISLVQNIYTPVNPDTRDINKNDRPFSSYLTLGLFHKSINIERGLKLSSELSVGIMGPAAMGGFVQSSIHDIEPVGWENQIKNDVYMNYSIRFDKLILALKKFEIISNANAKIGTIYNNIGAGFKMRLGRFNRFVENDLLIGEKDKKHRLNYWIFTSVQGNIIAYDATLQGGLFNASNQYVVDNSLLNTFVFRASVGMAVYYKNVGLELENFYLSPEFKGAYDFRYGRVNLIFGL